MRTLLRNILLFIPLFFLVLTWLGVVFGIKLIPEGLILDDTYEYTGDGKKETGLISLSWLNAIAFIAMIPGSFFCSIYTAYKKLWWWFAAYIVLAGIPLYIFALG